jgi:hypothetical protein
MREFSAMMDLVILLSISLAVTALLGLLLIGFVWVPWLIGLVLLVLLIALMKLTSSNEPQSAVSLQGDLVAQGQELGQERSSNNASAPSDEPVMVYRGVKYKRLPEDKTGNTPTTSVAEGKYRGQQWRR